jgi:hypothetical protein
MIVPGVLNGSRGQLYYPPDEIAKSVDAWNGVLITLDHPTDSKGNPTSASSPGIIERFGIGTIRNARSNGKLTADGWFDVERLKKMAPRTLNKLERGQPEELSTGLFTDNEPVKNKDKAIDDKGRFYTHVARNYRPDHLAVLVGKRGACSINDGCGVNINQGKQWYELVRNVSTSNKQLRLGTNLRKEKPMPLSKEQKDQVIKDLIENTGLDVEGPWVEEDREALNAMPEDKLIAFNGQREMLVNAMSESGEEDEEEEEEEVQNVQPPPPPVQKPKKKAPAKKPVTANEQPKPKTTKEWLADAPEEIRSAVTNAMELERRQKDDLISRITKNERNTFSKSYLEGRSLDELRGLAALAMNQEERQDNDSVLIPHYAGVPGMIQNVGEGFKDEDLDMAPVGVSDWKE